MSIEQMRTISFDGETVYTVPCPVEATEEMTQPVGVDGDGKLFTAPGGGGGGTGDHSQLTNRDASDQHPMSAITGLQNEFNLISDAFSDVFDSVSGLRTGKQDKLTAGSNISIVNNVISATSGGGGGANEVLVVEYEETSFADIYSALIAGKICYFDYLGERFYALKYATNIIYFIYSYRAGIKKWAACGSSTGWTEINNDPDLLTENSIVTEITASSTDTKVPSAKAVYDFVQSAVGDLSSLLGNGVIS